MPVYNFSVISNDDIGLDPYSFSEGTFTVGGAARSMSIADDDGIFDDESSEDGQAHPELDDVERHPLQRLGPGNEALRDRDQSDEAEDLHAAMIGGGLHSIDDRSEMK